MPKITFSIFFAIFIALNCFSQSKKPVNKTNKKNTVLLNKLSGKAVIGSNIKYYPEITKNSIVVNYSNSLFYLVNSKND
jgi:hypothetical protein